MDVSETLKRAWAAVEDAGLPVTVREVAFREAVRLLAPVPVVQTNAPTAPQARASGPTRKPSPTNRRGAPNDRVGDAASNGDGSKITESEDAIFGRVETQSGVSHEKLEELAHVDEGTLRVSLPGIKLGKNNAERTRAIAQILTILRGFGLDEQDTSLELIRAEAQRLRCYDQNNFSSHLTALKGYQITGSGQNRRIRAKSVGINGFSAFVDSLLDNG